MGTTRWVIAGLAVAAMVTLLGTGTAAAQEGDDGPVCIDLTYREDPVILRDSTYVLDSCDGVGSIVVGDVDVLVDERAFVDGPVVVANGTAVIRGHVTGDVVVLRGRAVVERTGRVEGDVLSSRPPLVRDGARVDGEVHRVRFRELLNGFGLAVRVAWWVAVTVSTLVAGLVFTGAFGGLARRTVDAGRRSVGASIGAGVGAGIGVPVVSALLLATLVALPLGLTGLLAMAPLYLAGYVAGAVFLGNLMLRERAGLVWSFVLGWLVLRLVGVLPVLGGLVTVAATVYGLGALLVAVWRMTRPAVPDPGDEGERGTGHVDPSAPDAPLPDPGAATAPT